MAVYSLAISESDTLVRQAKAQGILLVSRAQLLGAIMSPYPTRVAVSGSHGKSTTTAIVEHILAVAGRAHTAISGATLFSGSAYFDGGGEVVVAEACEYRDSFLSLCPTHQIVTSVALDHTDYFPSLEAVRRSFLRALDSAHTAIINLDDEVAASIREELLGAKIDTLPGENGKNDKKQEKTVLTYGKSRGAEYRIHTVTKDGSLTRFAITHKGDTYTLTTPLIGEFNLYNITAAVALADSLGIARESIEAAVESFCGVERRQSLLGYIGESAVYYDYAHHPDEIRSLISALKERYGTLTLVFRPHTYSRTKSLWSEFIAALSLADGVILLDVYPARESPLDGVTSQRLAECIDGAIYCHDAKEAAELATARRHGAIALVGAGEVEEVKSRLMEKIKHG